MRVPDNDLTDKCKSGEPEFLPALRGLELASCTNLYLTSNVRRATTYVAHRSENSACFSTFVAMYPRAGEPVLRSMMRIL